MCAMCAARIETKRLPLAGNSHDNQENIDAYNWKDGIENLTEA